jgi:hypothetical protein
MKIHELLEAKSRISLPEAKAILADIETGKGRIAEIVQKKPYLKEMSVNLVRQLHGGNIAVYRALSLQNQSDMREDKIASTTTSFDIGFNMANNSPGLIFTPTGDHSRSPMLLKYNITLDNVVAYVPALASHALDVLSNRISHIRDRRGDKLPISEIRNTAEQEKEIIADLSGVKPNQFPMDHSMDGTIWSGLLKDVHDGNYQNPDQYYDHIKSQSRNWFPDGMMDDPEKAVADFKKIIAQKANLAKKFLD